MNALIGEHVQVYANEPLRAPRWRCIKTDDGLIVFIGTTYLRWSDRNGVVAFRENCTQGEMCIFSEGRES